MSVTSPQQPFYPPQPPPGYGPPYVQRPPKKPMPQGVIALICVGSALAIFLLIGGFLSLMGSAGSTSSSDRETRVVSCSAASGGRFDAVGAQAEIEVTNKSTRAHTYTVTVSFTDGSGSTQYATGTAVIRDVALGQAGRGTATSWRGGDSSIRGCKITKVDQSMF